MNFVRQGSLRIDYVHCQEAWAGRGCSTPGSSGSRAASQADQLVPLRLQLQHRPRHLLRPRRARAGELPERRRQRHRPTRHQAELDHGRPAQLHGPPRRSGNLYTAAVANWRTTYQFNKSVRPRHDPLRQLPPAGAHGLPGLLHLHPRNRHVCRLRFADPARQEWDTERAGCPATDRGPPPSAASSSSSATCGRSDRAADSFTAETLRRRDHLQCLCARMNCLAPRLRASAVNRTSHIGLRAQGSGLGVRGSGLRGSGLGVRGSGFGDRGRDSLPTSTLNSQLLTLPWCPSCLRGEFPLRFARPIHRFTHSPIHRFTVSVYNGPSPRGRSPDARRSNSTH